MSAMYSIALPAIAPSRFAANVVVLDPTPLNRWANTRFAKKIGVSATSVATRKRGTCARSSSTDCGTSQAAPSETSKTARRAVSMLKRLVWLT
jgi:hypothetical protein